MELDLVPPDPINQELRRFFDSAFELDITPLLVKLEYNAAILLVGKSGRSVGIQAARTASAGSTMVHSAQSKIKATGRFSKCPETLARPTYKPCRYRSDTAI